MSRKDNSSNVVCLIDMDCFYCQVEEKLEPSLKGKPLAVVQYNAWQGGGIIAVNYAARDRGVTRHMRGDEAKKHCPEIELVKVPSVREKADLTKYREAGKEVAVVLQKFTSLLERASVDEAYLDITERVNDRLKLLNEGEFRLLPETLVNTFAVGFSKVGDFVTAISRGLNKKSNTEDDAQGEDLEDELDDATKISNLKLLIGATIVNEIRARVKEETGYDCSAGIAHNKILAKLACGLNKPNKQTVLPLRGVPDLFEALPVNKIKGLGGKLGDMVCETLKVKYMGDLLRFSERELQTKFDEKNGTFLYLICRGIDLEPVTPKYTSKSIGCCKKFPGKNAIKGIHSLNHWLKELATEIHDRLEKDFEENNRRAQLLTISYMQTINGEDVSSSRSIPLDSYDVEKVANDALECLKKNTEQFMCMKVEGGLHNPVKFLGLSVGKFEKISKNQNRIQEMFKQQIEAKMDVPPAVVSGASTEGGSMKPPTLKEPQPGKSNFFQKFSNKKNSIKKEEIAESTEMAMEVDTNQGAKSEKLPVKEGKGKDASLTIKSVSEINVSVPEAPLAPSNTAMEVNEEDPPGPSTATTTQMDYKMEYAEYSKPENLDWEAFMKQCPQCSVKVMNYEYEAHLDYHFAKALSEQQREESRQAIREKIQAKSTPKASPNGGSQRKVEKPASSQPTVSISKFLKARPEGELPAKKEEIECSECKCRILLEKFPEHADAHYLGKVVRDCNLIASPARQIPPKSSQAKKRKSPNDNSSQSRSILGFFTQPNSAK